MKSVDSFNIFIIHNLLLLEITVILSFQIGNNYNDSCTRSTQCAKILSAGGICQNGTCVCVPGYHYLHGKCHLSKGLHEICSYDDDCFIHAENQAVSCIDDSCQCSKGYYQREYSTCRRISKYLGDNCLIHSDCAGVKGARCFNKKCVKKSRVALLKFGFRKNDSGIEYEKSNDVYFSKITSIYCVTDIACKILPNSHCGMNKKCVCNRAHFLSADSRSCISEIGEACKTSDDNHKIPYTLCENKSWRCPFDRVALKNHRICETLTTTYDSECEYSEQCQLFGPRADCVDGRCVCTPGSYYLPAEHFCWISKNLGESCYGDRDCFKFEDNPKLQCRKKNSRDEEGICDCPKGNHLSLDTNQCLYDFGELNDPCEQNSDCGLENSICVHAFCQCKPGYSMFNLEKCLGDINASCGTDADCGKKNSVCIDHTCQCAKNYTLDSEMDCFQAKRLGEDCQKSEQCTALTINSNCIDNRCNCSYNYIEDGGQCTKVFEDLCVKNHVCCGKYKDNQVLCKDWDHELCHTNFYPVQECYRMYFSSSNTLFKTSIEQFKSSIILTIFIIFVR